MHLITINANGQILSMCQCDPLVSDSIDVLEVQFVFDSAWAGMVKTAQFTQKNKETQAFVTYNVLIDDMGIACIPNEITDGVCIISVFGVVGVQRMTTAPLAVSVLKSGFIGGGQTPIPPTPDLYQQIIEKMNAGSSGGSFFAPPIVVTKSGGAVSIADGLAAPALRFVSHIEPMQDGGGWESVCIIKTGKNLYTGGDITLTKVKTVKLPETLQPGAYTISAIVASAGQGEVSRAKFIGAGASGDLNVDLLRDVYAYKSFVTVNPCDTIYFYSGINNATSNEADATWRNVQISYESNFNVTTIPLPEPVQNGAIDWITGEVLSFLDADGNELTEPKRLMITPQQIDLLYGGNTIICTAGKTELEYIADTKLYIDERIAAIAAAVVN